MSFFVDENNSSLDSDLYLVWSKAENFYTAQGQGWVQQSAGKTWKAQAY